MLLRSPRQDRADCQGLAGSPEDFVISLSAGGHCGLEQGGPWSDLHCTGTALAAALWENVGAGMAPRNALGDEGGFGLGSGQGKLRKVVGSDIQYSKGRDI